MCFRNLPIEVDAQDHARLKPGVADPYTYRQGPLQIDNDRERFEDLFEGCDSLRQIDVGRMTSVAGGIVVDLPALLELVVDRGCALELAVRIVAPLEWKPPTNESTLSAEGRAELLDQYAEAPLRGEDAAWQFPAVASRLRNVDCREDSEGLLAYLRQADESPGPER